MWKGLVPILLVQLSLFSSPRVRIEFRVPVQSPVAQPSPSQSILHIPEASSPGRSWKSKYNSLIAKAHTFPADSLPSWAFCSGVMSITFAWTPSNVFSTLVLMFLNPNAEFQQWAHQLSPDYFLSVCQASSPIWLTMLFLLYLLVKKWVSLPALQPWAVCHSSQIQSPGWTWNGSNRNKALHCTTESW